MSNTSKIAALLATCLTTIPLLVSANETNEPSQKEVIEISRIAEAAKNEVELAKRMQIAYGIYDLKSDPAAKSILRIMEMSKMLSGNRTDASIISSMHFITKQIGGMQERINDEFQSERSKSCDWNFSIKDDRFVFVANPGTSPEQASMFCRMRPDWKRYEVNKGGLEQIGQAPLGDIASRQSSITLGGKAIDYGLCGFNCLTDEGHEMVERTCGDQLCGIDLRKYSLPVPKNLGPKVEIMDSGNTVEDSEGGWGLTNIGSTAW